MKTSQAQKEATVRYIKEHADRLSTITSKEHGALIRDTAKQLNLSVNAFIISAINHEIAQQKAYHEYAELLNVDVDSFISLAVNHYIATPKILDILSEI